MKTFLSLLLIACFLVTLPTVAGAYEPTNGFALESIFNVTKITVKEEVVHLYQVHEKSDIPSVPIPAETIETDYSYCVLTKFPVYEIYYDRRIAQEADRDHSRFT